MRPSIKASCTAGICLQIRDAWRRRVASRLEDQVLCSNQPMDEACPCALCSWVDSQLAMTVASSASTFRRTRVMAFRFSTFVSEERAK
jgi:hypothetical protein